MATHVHSDWQGLFFSPYTGKFQLVKSKAKRHSWMCSTKFCRNPASVEFYKDGRIRKRRTSCNRCRSRLNRANNPEMDAYHHLRDSAKKRAIRFTLTFDQFLNLVEGTEYIAKRGRTKGCLHIDRIRAGAGYEFGNLRVIDASHNVGKGNIERHHKQKHNHEIQDDPF